MRQILQIVSILSLIQTIFYWDFNHQILCNKRQDLSVDSILVFNETQLYLFSGNDFYRLSAIAMTDKYEITDRNPLSSISEAKPTIDNSYKGMEGGPSLILVNVSDYNIAIYNRFVCL